MPLVCNMESPENQSTLLGYLIGGGGIITVLVREYFGYQKRKTEIDGESSIKVIEDAKIDVASLRDEIKAWEEKYSALMEERTQLLVKVARMEERLAAYSMRSRGDSIQPNTSKPEAPSEN